MCSGIGVRQACECGPLVGARTARAPLGDRQEIEGRCASGHVENSRECHSLQQGGFGEQKINYKPKTPVGRLQSSATPPHDHALLTPFPRANKSLPRASILIHTATMLAALTHSSAALLLPLPNRAPQKAAAATVHIKIGGKWYDATEWADKHPGGRYVLEWADGYDVTNAFHTIHLFSSKKASDMLARMPEADLSTRARRELVLPPIERVPMRAQAPTGMDRFMGAGERVVELLSPPAAMLPDRVPVRPASGLAWQQQASVEGAEGAVGAVGESALKRELEELLHRHFASPAEYKATPEHWVRIGGAFALWALCLAGWVAGSLPATLALPFAQWLLFSPTVHEPGLG